MIEPAHGIEGVRSVPNSGLDASGPLLQSGIGVPNADTDSAARGIDNESKRTLQLRRKGEHRDATSGCIPHLVESFTRDRLQVDTRMEPTPGMAEEGAFQMNPQRLRANGICADFTVRAFRRPGQIIERLQR